MCPAKRKTHTTHTQTHSSNVGGELLQLARRAAFFAWVFGSHGTFD